MFFSFKNGKYVPCVFTAILLCFCICMHVVGNTSQPILFKEENVETLYRAELVPPYTPREGAVNINTASAAELTTLRGIGNTLAARVVAHREKYGAFRHPIWIMQVEGIGEKKYEAIREHITVK